MAWKTTEIETLLLQAPLRAAVPVRAHRPASGPTPVITLGLIGMGGVGTAVVRLLRENGDLIEKRTGIRLELRRVAVKHLSKRREIELPSGMLTDRAEAVAADPSLDLVIELMGGLSPARKYVLRALESGKSVVTANKALLATWGGQLLAAAARSGVDLACEASVAGTIPILRVLEEGLAANRIERIVGIINGTTNYILTRMAERGEAFAEALADAQKQGLAEADPTLDVSGEDAAHKLAILAALAFGLQVRQRDLYVEGIESLTPEDFAGARSFGYALKLLAVAKAADQAVELRVHPTLVPLGHPLAAIRNEFNAVMVMGDASRETMYVGRGAGPMPTASAVLSDVIACAERRLGRCPVKEHAAAARGRRRNVFWGQMKIRKMADVVTRHYLRFPVHDEPGAIGTLTTTLGRHRVSISDVRASVVDADRARGVVEIVTHAAAERDVAAALGEIAKTSVLRAPVRLLRIEDLRA